MNTLTKTYTETKFSFFNDLNSIVRSNRLVQIMLCLLAVQLLLAAILGTRSTSVSSFATGESLISSNVQNVGNIEITADDQVLTLTKSSGQWRIDGDLKLPVQASKMDILLERLSTLKTGLPVANSENSREQLRVADDNYLRRIRFSGENLEPTVLLLGTSPGLRKSHLRREDANDIYSATLPVSDFPVRLDDWMDKSLLSFSDIKSIASEGRHFTLSSEDEDAAWSVHQPSDEARKIDTKKFGKAIEALKNIRVNGVVMNDDNSENAVSPETLEIKIMSGESEIELTLMKSDDNKTVKRSDIAGVFTLSNAQFDRLTELASLDAFLVDAIENDPSESTAADKK